MAAASGAAHVPLPCTQCGTGRAKCCTGCRLAFFCGRECQRAAWPVHAAQCNSRKLGPLSPAPKAALVDAGAQGAGLRATASIAAGEEVLCEPPLLLTSAERSAAIHQRLGGGELSQSRTAEAYVLHILSGVHALYDAPDHTRRAVMTELCQPVRDLKAAMDNLTVKQYKEVQFEALRVDPVYKLEEIVGDELFFGMSETVVNDDHWLGATQTEEFANLIDYAKFSNRRNAYNFENVPIDASDAIFMRNIMWSAKVDLYSR